MSAERVREMGAYKSLRHELLESESSAAAGRSNENAEAARRGEDLSSFVIRSGMFSAEVWLEGGGEKGGEGDGDEEKRYLWWFGPTLTGRGDGGVGGDDDGDAYPLFILSPIKT